MEATDGTAGQIMVHATCVSVDGRAALIRGRSGSGKSGLALQLLARGAGLVADDRTVLTRDATGLIASCPAAIRDRIEARGLGLLHVPSVGPQPVACLVDMDATVSDRMPRARFETLLGLRLPLINKSCHVHFPDAVLLYLRHGSAE